MSRYENPADNAMPYMQQIPGTVTPYYNPYIQAGQKAGGMMFDQYGRMVQDPNAYYNNMMSGYTESPGAQYQQQQMQQSMAGSAAAGGYSGTPYDQQQQADAISGILSKDQQRYFNNVFGVEQSGLQGEQHFFDTGYSASNTLAQMLAENLAAEAGLEFQGTQYENMMKQQQRNNLFKATSMGLGAGMGGLGYYMGGKK